MPIKVQECYNALAKLHLPPEQYKNYKSMCDDHLSIAGLMINEIPTKGNCTKTDAYNYIQEETEQMAKYLGKLQYNMFDISVPEHVLLEDTVETEHDGLYIPASGDIKFFEEWLEGHHPSLGCIVNKSNQVPSDAYYNEIAKARIEARGFR